MLESPPLVEPFRHKALLPSVQGRSVEQTDVDLVRERGGERTEQGGGRGTLGQFARRAEVVDQDGQLQVGVCAQGFVQGLDLGRSVSEGGSVPGCFPLF